jgi:adenine phosphoribosyltransferase
MNIKKYIKDIPDFPKEGIVFKDISPLLNDVDAFRYVIHTITNRYQGNKKPNKVVGMDARGFIFGSAVAFHLAVPFVMVRKAGKLPGDCISINYDLEYGSNTFEIQEDAINENDKCLIVDDLLATGGSAKAVGELINQLGGTITALECVVELQFLNGKDVLNFPVRSQAKYE